MAVLRDCKKGWKIFVKVDWRGRELDKNREKSGPGSFPRHTFNRLNLETHQNIINQNLIKFACSKTLFAKDRLCLVKKTTWTIK